MNLEMVTPPQQASAVYPPNPSMTVNVIPNWTPQLMMASDVTTLQDMEARYALLEQDRELATLGYVLRKAMSLIRRYHATRQGEPATESEQDDLSTGIDPEYADSAE